VATERDPWQRALFRLNQHDVDASGLVVVDEFGSNLDLTRTYARAPRGVRAVQDVPRNTPLNTTTIAALTLQGMGPALMVEGGVNRATIEVYLEHVLGPTLRAGQIVLLDNLSAHCGGRVREIIEARGCHLRYLPPYSPDFSPIELAFSKVKSRLCRAAARTHTALEDAIANALSLISSADAQAFFAHCGYCSKPNLDQYFCS